MKKTYMAPRITVIQVDQRAVLLAGSTGLPTLMDDDGSIFYDGPADAFGSDESVF